MTMIYRREIDSLGRIVIPKKILQELGIDKNTELEIHTEADLFIISKYKNFCCFCKRTIPTLKYKNKYICNRCFNELKKVEFTNGKSKNNVKLSKNLKMDKKRKLFYNIFKKENI